MGSQPSSSPPAPAPPRPTLLPKDGLDVAIEFDDLPDSAAATPGPAETSGPSASAGRGDHAREADRSSRGRDRDAGPRTRSRRKLLLVAGVVTLGVVVLIAGFVLTRRDLAVACDDADAGLAGVWDDARRDALRGAFTATGLADAKSVWERFATLVDAYAGAWRESRRGACVAHQRGEHAADLHGLQVACLERRRGALKALVDALESADAKAVEQAIAAAGELPPVAACNDLAAPTSPFAPPGDPQVAAEVHRLREQLERARAALSLRKVDEGLAIAAPLLARARELGYVPLEAEVAGVVASLQALGADLDAAEQTLVDAVWLADQVHDDALLAEQMAALLTFLGDRRGRHEDALRWRRHADSVRARLPAQSPLQARLLNALAGALSHQGRNDEAIALHEQALAIDEALHGPDDPRLRASLTGLGGAALRKADVATARRHYARALEIQEAAFGKDHPTLGDLFGDLAAAAAQAREDDLALEYARRALTIQEAAFGEDHPELAELLDDISAALTRKGDLAAARPYLERRLALREKLHGAEHPSVVLARIDLADVAGRLGDVAASREHAARAVAIGEQVLTGDDPQLAAALYLAGSYDLRDGKPNEALPRLERALAIREARGDTVDAVDLARSRFGLAVAVREGARDPARAQALANQALAGLRAAEPERGAELIAEIERWLAAAPAPEPDARGKKKKKTKKAKAKKKKKK